MLPADILQQRLAAAGISTQSRIVVYFGRENPLVSPTARVMFTLDYAGLGEQASLLDGGLEAWVKAGKPLSTELPAERTGTLSPLTLRPIVVDAEFVKANLASREHRDRRWAEHGLLQRRADRRRADRAAQDRTHPGRG